MPNKWSTGKKATAGPLALLANVLFLTGCLFNQDPTPPRPITQFNFHRMDSLDQPLAKWYSIPKEKSLIGLAFAFRSTDYKQEVDANITGFSLAIGRTPALAGAYFDISSQGKNLRTMLDAVHAQAAIPYVTFDPKDWDEPNVDYQKTFLSLIIQGAFDAKLKELAGVVRDFGFPILLRYAHEMNGNWYPYSGSMVGGGLDSDRDGQPDGPQTYIEAWRYVHDVFTREGADKVVWVYCPNGESFPKADWNRPFSYYPGSDYVDLIASDSYEAPEKRRWNLDHVMADFFNEMGLFWESQSGNPENALRPFGIGEFGTPRTVSSEKAIWYQNALQYIAGDNRIKFHVLYNDRNGSQDFSLTGLGDALQTAYAQDVFQYKPELLATP